MTNFVSLNHAFIECCTGFDVTVLDEYIATFNVLPNKVPDLVAALTVMHTNCTDEQLCVFFMGIFGQNVPRSTLADRVTKMNQYIFDQPMLSRETERFSMADPNMANVTAIGDGTSVNVRLPDRESGFKGKCTNFQVLTKLNGDLMIYSGPFTGRLTDSRNFCEDPTDAERIKFCPARLVTRLTFPHRKNECMGMDGAYKANLHGFVPYEAVPEDATDVPNRKKRLWNYLFALRRSRIERKFGQLDRHKFFHYCLRTVSTVALMFRLMWNAEIIKARATPSLAYADELVQSSTLARDLGPACDCNWAGMWPVTHPQRVALTTYRSALCDDYVAKNGFEVRITRPSQHESKAKKRERDDNTPLAVVSGQAKFVIKF